MADERTPLLDSAGVNEQRGQDAWTASCRAMLLLPVVIVMTLNHAFHDIVPLFFPQPFLGKLTFRAAAVAIGFLSCCLSTPFWSNLGDKYGRRPVILVSICSALVPNLGLLLVHHLGLSEAFYLSAIMLGGFLGGYTTFRGVMYAYTADMVADGHRLGVFSIFQGFICISYFAPDYLTRLMYLSDREDVNQVAVLVWPLVLALGLVLLFTILRLPESFSRPVQHPEGQALSGMRLWLPSSLLTRLSLVGLALCVHSFVPPLEETLGQFFWGTSEWFLWQGIFLRAVRYFMVIPVLAFNYRPSYFSPFQWDIRLAVLSPLVICGIMLGSSVLAVIPSICPSFFVICPGPLVRSLVLWLGFVVLPILCNVGGFPTLYSFATGYFRLANRRYEWGLLFGGLSILQSFSESMVSELDPFMKVPQWIERFPLAAITVTAYLVPQLATARLVWLSTRPRLNSI